MRGAITGRSWTAADDDVMFETYPGGGWTAVRKILRDRSKNAIQARAMRLGITVSDAKGETDTGNGWAVPAPADLSVQLLNLHNKRAYGAQPMGRAW